MTRDLFVNRVVEKSWVSLIYFMDEIVSKKTTEYITSLVKRDDETLEALEDYATKNMVPIVTKEVSRYIETLIHIIKPKKVLELGCAIGYSAILMAKSNKDLKITTIERDPKMAQAARENFKKYGYEDRIELIEGDALEELKNIKDEFDMVFIDAGKSHYNEFYSDIVSKISPGGVILCDNVLYKGMIADDDLVKRRKKTIVKRMRNFLDIICEDEKLITSVIPIGDGMSLSYVKKEDD